MREAAPDHGVGAPRDSAGEGRSPSSLGAAQARVPTSAPSLRAQRGGTQRSRGGAPAAPPPGRGRSPRSNGLTLIEILVVIAIIATASLMVVPAVNSLSGADAKKAAGELAGSMRALFDTAALRHQTCRLAIDLPEEKDKRPTYWAECAPGPAGAAAAGARDEDDDDLARRFPDEADPEIRRMLSASTFGKLKDRMIAQRELPGRTRFGPIHLEGRRDAQETGTAYVYFFPGGQAQRAWIPVVDGKNLFTVVTEPFTGRVRVVAGKVEVKE